MKQEDEEETQRLGIQIGMIIKRDPGSVVLAMLDHLLDRSLGSNRSLLGHLKLNAYRAIAEWLKRSGKWDL